MPYGWWRWFLHNENGKSYFVLVPISFAVITAMWKSKLRRKGLISYYRQVKAETQGKSLNAGTEAEAMEERCLLSSLSAGCSVCFFHTPGTPAQGGTAHNGLGPPISIINFKMHRLACRLFLWRHLLKCDSLYSGTSDLCQIDNKLARTGGFTVFINRMHMYSFYKNKIYRNITCGPLVLCWF